MSTIHSSQAETWVNTRSDISSRARGQREGSLLKTSTRWQEEVSPPEETSPDRTAISLPELPGPGAASSYTVQTDLHGHWQGNAQPSYSFWESGAEATQLTVSAQQKNDTLELQQELYSGLQQETRGQYRSTDTTLKLGMTLKTEAGQNLLSVEHKYGQNASGAQSHETQVNYQASPALQINSTQAQTPEQQTARAGFHYSPAEAENTSWSVSGQSEQMRSAESQTRSQNLTLNYGPAQLSWEEAQSTSAQVGSSQTCHNIQLQTKTLEDQLQIDLSQKVLIENFLNASLDPGSPTQTHSHSQRAQLNWQTTTGESLGYVYSKELLTVQSRTESSTRSESHQIQLEYTFTSEFKGQFTYTHEVNQRQLLSARLNYATTPDDIPDAITWSVSYEQETHPDPLLGQKRLSLDYSSVFPEEGLAMEYHYTLTLPVQGPGQWDSSLRLYGEGTTSLPLEAKLQLSSERTPLFSLNLHQDF